MHRLRMALMLLICLGTVAAVAQPFRPPPKPRPPKGSVVEICNTDACGLCCTKTKLGFEVCSPCCCKVRVDE